MAAAKTGKLQGNALIGQSGGPTVVINQSLVGAVLEARLHAQIGKFYGAMHGLQGILSENLIDLSREPAANLERIAQTPSAALGSVRMRPTEDQCGETIRILKKLGVRYFFYIGGNDTAETARIVDRLARKEKYPLTVFHIPKTIDNDLKGSDHTPGYGSAARFVAEAFMGIEMDNRSLPGINIVIVMGRNAGFLTAASSLGRAREDSGPHLVYVPERAFIREKFIEDVRRVMDRWGRCVVAASEGLTDPSGRLVSTLSARRAVDDFGNVQLSGTGKLGDYLSDAIKEGLADAPRVRADTLGYLQRSFAGVVSPTDAREAREVGRRAVQWAVKGHRSTSVAILREPGPRYKVSYGPVDLKIVARYARPMPASFINRAGNNTTKKFLDYARPLVGKLPTVAFLKGYEVK